MISHVALRVSDVAIAEAYYCQMFGMEVAFRDLTVGGVQQSLRPGVTWSDAAERGLRPGLSSLWRGGANIAIEQAPAGESGRLDHIGLYVELSEVEEIAGRAKDMGCSILQQRADLVVFDDQFGVRWELTSTRYARPEDQSTGARTGAWLDLA